VAQIYSNCSKTGLNKVGQLITPPDKYSERYKVKI